MGSKNYKKSLRNEGFFLFKICKKINSGYNYNGKKTIFIVLLFSMDSSLISYLQSYGFGEKEAAVYITCLELGSSIASTIARRSEINRGTTYSILEDFKRRWIATEIQKDGTKYFSVISPDVLFKNYEEKYQKIKNQLPELLAVTNKFGNRPRTQFFEWFGGLKKIFEEVLLAWEDMTEPYLSFVWTDRMDPKVEQYINEEFVPRRMKIKTKTKAIMSKNNSEYMQYHKKSHDTIVVDKPLFNLWNEIVVFGKNKIAVLMYATDEMSWLIIESQTLHDGLRSLFTLLRDAYKLKK